MPEGLRVIRFFLKFLSFLVFRNHSGNKNLWTCIQNQAVALARQETGLAMALNEETSRSRARSTNLSIKSVEDPSACSSADALAATR